LGAFVTRFEFGFSHALTVEFDAVCVVHEAVEDGVSEGGLDDASACEGKLIECA